MAEHAAPEEHGKRGQRGTLLCRAVRNGQGLGAGSGAAGLPFLVLVPLACLKTVEKVAAGTHLP